jgi:hypothetical protein
VESAPPKFMADAQKTYKRQKGGENEKMVFGSIETVLIEQQCDDSTPDAGESQEMDVDSQKVIEAKNEDDF